MMSTLSIANNSFKKILTFLNPVKYKVDKISNPFKQSFNNIEFIGKHKPTEKPHIPKPTSSIITDFQVANLLFMNINSIQSVDKRELAEMGVRKGDPEIVIFAETKAAPVLKKVYRTVNFYCCTALPIISILLLQTSGELLSWASLA